MNRVKELREKNGLTMQKLADETNIGKSTIASYESRGVTPKPDKAQKLAEYFNVSVAYLLGYIDTPKEELMTFDTGEEFEKARQNLLDKYSSEKKQIKKKGIDLTKMFEEMKKNDFKPTTLEHPEYYEMSEDELEEIKRIEEEQQAEQKKYEDAVNLYFKEIAKLLDVYEKEMIVELYRLSQENQDKVRRYIYSLRSDENK